MLVARSFKYSSPASPPPAVSDKKTTPRKPTHNNIDTLSHAKEQAHALARPRTPPQTSRDTMRPRSQPVDVPSPERARSSGAKTVGYGKGRTSGTAKRSEASSSQHRPEALSPSVAALLAMTTIPRRPRQTRKRNTDKRQISIDELVNQWRSDDSLGRSYDSSPLSILLDRADDSDESRSPSWQSSRYSRPEYERSASSDSIPSLEADDRSLLSFGSPATPESIRSRKSSMNIRKETPRSQPVRENCVENHPLITTTTAEDDDGLDFSPIQPTTAASKSKSSFKSNLTTSLQALKAAALSPFAPRKTASAPNLRARRSETIISPLSDEVLWSHPFLFPRFSPEIRPEYKGTPTSAQRRYLNPTPLTFEEQEAPFQQALHAPYLAEQLLPGADDSPTIQMQTYTRSRRSGGSKPRGGSACSDDDAAAAAVNAAAMRQREPRENSDFLRVVVLEMNMRREGKLESGRARIWLPPRQGGAESEGVVAGKGGVPRRWVGVSAE